MGLFSFIKDAGAAVFGSKPQEETAENKTVQLNNYLSSMGFDLANVRFSIEGDKVTLKGKAASHEIKEKLIVAVGNANGIAQVDDQIEVEAAAVTAAVSATSKMYTVKSGDNLSKIAKECYGDANKYQKIFEANKPMLAHPDKIFVGQVLRIPSI